MPNYRYTFAPDAFVSVEDHGVHVSRETVTPDSVEPVDNLIARLQEADVELRFCPSLTPLGKAIIRTTLHFSLIRMRHARGWEGSTGSLAVPRGR